MNFLGPTPEVARRRLLLLSISCISLVALILVQSAGVGAATVKTTSTAAGLKKAGWGSNVTVSFSKGAVRYRSDGLPNHARQAQYALPNAGVAVPNASSATAGADPTKAQNYDFTITTSPKKAKKTTSTSLGTIGVMISGAALYNPYEGDGATVAVQSNFTVPGAGGTAVAFLDSCNGHPTPNAGAYHYHALPACVTAQVDKAKGPSHIIGLAFDGFPIYGDRDIKGRKVSLAKLDTCNGITSATPEYPKGIYHYVLPDTATSRSSIRCFAGTVSASLVQAMPGMGPRPAGGPPAAGVRSLVCDLAHRAAAPVTA